jgi:hypothetical protein
VVQVMGVEVQNWTPGQTGHEVCEASRYRPSTQSEQIELAGPVQVRVDSQPSTGEHGVHSVGRVADRQYPASHCVQFELVALVQVSASFLQKATGVHAEQVWVTGSRYHPAAHSEHRESDAVVQVTWPTQPGTAVHCWQVSGCPSGVGGSK